MKTPAIIYLVIVLISGFITANKHGKPREGTESFWVWLLSTAIILRVLWWGGFFY